MRAFWLAALFFCVFQLAHGDERGRGSFRHMDSDRGSWAGAYLCAEAAMVAGDYSIAADQFGVALQEDPNNQGVLVQALDASLMAGRFAVPLAWRVARIEPGNPIAEAVLADDAAMAGAWPAAAQHFAAMSGDGALGLMRQPLLAWAQFAAGRHDAMRTLMNARGGGTVVGGAYLFQAGLMADLDDRPVDAERFYRTAQTDLGPQYADLARALASLLARQGRQAEALSTLDAAGGMGLGLKMSAARLKEAVALRPVRDAADAMAGVYVSFAALAWEHHAADVAQLLLRLALNLRPDLTEARLMGADMLAAAHRPAAALAMLAPVEAGDVLAPSVAERRAALLGLVRRK